MAFRNFARISILLLLGFLICVPASAQDKNTLSISGSSNAADWSCESQAVNLNFGSGGTAEPVSGFPNGIANFKVTLAVDQLRCDKGKKMEEHMSKALKAKDFPAITFEMTGYNLKNGNLASVVGKLTIAGQTKDVKFDVKLKKLDSDAGFVVSGETKISMPDYGVKPPSLMFGALNVYPDVEVEFEVVLHPSATN